MRNIDDAMQLTGHDVSDYRSYCIIRLYMYIVDSASQFITTKNNLYTYMYIMNSNIIQFKNEYL